MKKRLNILQYFILPAILVFTFVSCNHVFFQPKFGYLKKVAVMAQSETDTLVAHISEWREIRSLQQNDTLFENQICQSENPITPGILKADAPGPIRFCLNETKRILLHHPKRLSSGLHGDSKASAGGINGWVLGLLVFFGSLVLFALVISWAIQEQMGCLASGLAVFALLFEIWLVMFVLM